MLLRGEKINLRPVNRDDLEWLDEQVNQIEDGSNYNFFGLKRAGYLEPSFAEDGLLGFFSGSLMIVTFEDTLVGEVSYRQKQYGPNRGSMVYEIGINVASEFRGRGYGIESQKLLTDYLFSIYNIQRIEASTDITNIAEQRALEKAGFTREGVLRQAQWRMGAWHDLVLYSKLRGE